ncbi:MAG TPA: EAL domain-containing protein [Candidatus Limnocylindria bacterium]
MTEAAAAATASGRPGLALRLLGALLVAGAIAMMAERLLVEAVPDYVLRTVLSALSGAGVVAVGLWRMVVNPLVASRDELNERYEAALADSLTDPLTGLGNHRAFQEELDRQVEAAQRYEVPLSLVVIDLDEFKLVNDRNGHAEGDRTLRYFGRLLSSSVRRPDRPFRIGGDEFAVLLPHTDLEGARIVARRLLATSLQPALRLDDAPRSGVSFSAGVSALPEPASTRAQLYAQADAALYQAKHAGRTEVVAFDPTAAAEDGVPEGSAAEVATVIAHGLLRPVYQPIIDLVGARQLGMEGLIRPVPPAPFANPGTLFAAARAGGHLVELDLTCVETIVAGAGALEPNQFLAVNLSPATLQAPEFSAASLISILARHGFPSARLVIEMTERGEIDDLDRVRARLEDCRKAGMRIAADDVGAGNAGLRLLSQLQFDIIKVDLTLVQRSATSAASSAVIESVVALASRTGALVIGEGVEETSQLAKLGALGVTAAQGYLLGRPEPMPQLPPRPAVDPRPAPVPAAGEPVASPMSAWRQSIGLPAA